MSRFERTELLIGKDKVEVIRERLLDISSEITVYTYKVFISADTLCDITFDKFDYVVDAIDTVSSKIALIEKACEHNVPIISAMGAGNKLSIKELKVADIYDTKVCPLAKTIRTELKKRDIKGLKVVYSEESPQNEISKEEREENFRNRKKLIGSISYVPAAAGLLIAEEVIKDIMR